jgi:hypothetical protein
MEAILLPIRQFVELFGLLDFGLPKAGTPPVPNSEQQRNVC